MKIIWVSFTMFERGGSLGLTSELASARYRILFPVAELNRRGHQITLASVGDDASAQALFSQLSGDIIIFCKSVVAANEGVAAAARARGMKVVFDVCDNHFEHDVLGGHYRAMVELADAVTCSTAAMADIAKQYAGVPCPVIDDPYEGVRQLPSYHPAADCLKLMWFGHPLNLDSLEAAAPALINIHANYPLSLSVVTRLPETQMQEVKFQRFRQAFGEHIPLTVMPWSLEEQYRVMRESDLVIIPSLQNAQKQVKSPNRMVESLWAGKMVIAQPVPAYEDFSKWAWIGPELEEGIAWAMQHRQEIPGRIAEAQEYIAKRFSPATIGERWEHVLANILDQRAAAQA